MNNKKLAHLELSAYKKLGSTFNRNRKYLGYRYFLNSEKYFIYKHIGGKNKIVAAYGNIVCTKANKTTLFLYPNYRNTFFRYKIKLSSKHFESLLPNSTIDVCFILPYCRKCSSGNIIDSWRLVIVTNKCQVFHNFPSHSENMDLEGEIEPLDIIRFDESAVWDLPNKKYPSNSQAHDKSEFYFPGFDEETYHYHPAINGITKNKYGNKGFPKFIDLPDGSFVSRFYFPERKTESNPFFYLNGLEIDTKITLLGTYRSNTNSSSRIVVLATVDGGRNWYAKYEFSDTGEYDFRQGNKDNWGLNHGKSINGELLEKIDNNSLTIRKRQLSLDNTKNYQVYSNPIKVERIINSNPITIVTKEQHNLKNGNIVVIQGEADSSLNYLLNNNASSSSSGNGLFFKVVVQDENSFFLFENVSNVDNTLPCRHIHFIDRQRDGWTIGTGEIYPNGWLLFMGSREGDTYSDIDIMQPFLTKQLTFSQSSIQRSMGLYLFERNEENYLVYASDHDLLNRETTFGPNTIERNSTGVYVGKLSSLDDYKNTFPIFETNEPCLFFKLIGDDYIFGGQRGLLAFGHRFGKEWEVLRIENAIKRYHGETSGFIVIDDYLFIKK